jgi:type VI secretion system protein ImpH
VEFFHEHGQMRARMRFNLIGLVGSGSPLPAFYGEQALGDSEDGNPTRNFLDLFHHRLQRLMLPIWRSIAIAPASRAARSTRSPRSCLP